VLQNNLEAAEEIGRQLRLRDIGGIIVIDFIDMETEKNQQQVMRRLRETLARDRTRTQVFEVSHLGLVEMTRKNVSPGLLETFSHKCEACEGRGHHPPRGSGRAGRPPRLRRRRRLSAFLANQRVRSDALRHTRPWGATAIAFCLHERVRNDALTR
jgi:ribonuclease E